MLFSIDAFIHSNFETFECHVINSKHLKLEIEISQASATILEETNEFVEKWTKIGVIATSYVAVPCIVAPKVLISFYVYFMTDSGNDAFDLPVPMW